MSTHGAHSARSRPKNVFSRHRSRPKNVFSNTSKAQVKAQERVLKHIQGTLTRSKYMATHGVQLHGEGGQGGRESRAASTREEPPQVHRQASTRLERHMLEQQTCVGRRWVAGWARLEALLRSLACTDPRLASPPQPAPLAPSHTPFLPPTLHQGHNQACLKLLQSTHTHNIHSHNTHTRVSTHTHTQTHVAVLSSVSPHMQHMSHHIHHTQPGQSQVASEPPRTCLCWPGRHPRQHGHRH